jgi:hypothetical protein
VVRHCIGFGLTGSAAELRERQERWTTLAAGRVLPPRGRAAAGPARELGADTAAVLEELGIN